MEQADAGLGVYRALFRIPGTGSFVAASLAGRVPMATLSLATVFLVTDVTGSYAAAGAVASVGALCYALVVPQLGYLIDRFGQRRVLRPLAWSFAVTGALFLLVAWRGAPLWQLMAAGAAFGASMPPVSALARARWSHLADVAGPRPGAGGTLLRTAYSFESVADELIFILGPALVATAAALYAGAAVAFVAAFGAVGGLCLAAHRRTEPPVRPHGADGGRAIAVPGLRVLCMATLCVAGMFAAHELSTLAFVEEHGRTWMSGAVLGTYAVGSAIGGLWYGVRAWRLPLDRRYLLALTAMVAGVAPLWAMPGVPALWAVSLLSGLLIAPAVIAQYSLVREGVPAGMLTEGMTWLATSVGMGKAVGVSVAGLVIDAFGARAGYVFSLGCGCLAIAAALLGARRLRAMTRPHRPGGPSEAGKAAW